MLLAAFCGGNYTKGEHLPEMAHHDISDIYGVYLTASTLGDVSERDIAVCNKIVALCSINGNGVISEIKNLLEWIKTFDFG